MEFPAASVLRGRVPWLGLLLAVFLLTSWIPPTTALFDPEFNFALEGKDVILRLRNTTPDVTGFIWYRGMEMEYPNFIGSLARDTSEYLTGPEYSGREEINLDGSLIIRNVTARDENIYSVVAVFPNSRRVRDFRWLGVSRPLSVPTLLASNTTVTENEDAVVMTCHTDGRSINWLFNAMSLPLSERMKLTKDRRTLTIDPVRREDAGNYQCKVSNMFSSFKSAPVVLDVKYKRPNYCSPSIFPIPSFYPLLKFHPAYISNFQSPAQISWLFDGKENPGSQDASISRLLADSSGNLGESRERSASQWKKITLRTFRVRGKLRVPTLLASNTTVTENEDAVVMTCYTDESSTKWLFNNTSLQLRERMKLSQDNKTLTIDPVRREDAGNYQCKVSHPLSSKESAPVELDVK
uniref:Ig-like domain-containing protein n=1 Tax=Myotis lucifugus TaxID=59463 RepID=L7N139_MYOLU